MNNDESSSALLLSMDIFLEAYHNKMILGDNIRKLLAVS
jgi:hypothetical protein